MTVHGINSGPSDPGENPDSPDDSSVKEETAVEELAATTQERTSCFFEWRLLPQHRIGTSLTHFKCDLCLDEIEGEFYYINKYVDRMDIQRLGFVTKLLFILTQKYFRKFLSYRTIVEKR